MEPTEGILLIVESLTLEANESDNISITQSALTITSEEAGTGFDISRKCFEPSEMKEWAIDDLNKTIQWLESQEEKPDPSEVTKIAAEGILTCLQDVIRSLEEKREDFGNLNKIFIFSGKSLHKLGGRMVYSTCSKNLIENEVVVTKV
ncbi:DNA-repair protein XRCC1-like [Vigna unguiculata]|uniref:DNA-repair protein XRCC1-like n=1 Tax=Vigna unguiculata TaxID=3917 RepID=UPI0010160676|nr:DNA-repair protein XRCC1-like [Vigna unguiculata]